MNRRVLTALVVVAALTAASGCGTSPQTRFYLLTPVVTPNVDRVSMSEPLMIGVRRVTVPAELDRPQIVTRTGANTMQLAEFHRWSAPLRDSVLQQLATNLAALLPDDRVEAYPWMSGTAVDREVAVDIVRFDGELDGPCTLRARWTVVTRTGTPSTLYGESVLSEASGRDYASLVAAQSRLLGALSADIANAIRGGGPPRGVYGPAQRRVDHTRAGS